MNSPNAKYFNKLPSNLITYIYQFFPLKEIINHSQICKKFQKAFKNDFIWEKFARSQCLFMPSERENFSGWKEYYNYLFHLEKNIREGKSNKSFIMVPYRGHKSVITAVLPIEMSNSPFSVLISGDSLGKVNTWDKDEEGDYESSLLVDIKDEVIDIQLVNRNKIVLWNKKNDFYFYEVDIIHYKEKKYESNKERFKLISNFNIEIGSFPVKQIYIDEQFNQIFVARDFHLKHDKFNNKIVVYSIIQKERDFSCEMYFSYLAKNIINSQHQRVTSINFNPNSFSLNTFAVTPSNIYYFTNQEFLHNKDIYLYSQKESIANCFIYNRALKFTKEMRVDLDYIYSVNYLKEEAQVLFLGIRAQKYYALIYKQMISSLKLVKEVLLAIDYFNGVFSILYLDNTFVHILYHTFLLKFNLKDYTISEIPIELKDEIHVRLNAVVGDKYRLVLGFDNNLIKVINIQKGEMWYNLLGGSRTVVPKSFIKNPNYDGFNIIKLTRWSIVGVMGNLIREYLFNPEIQ